MVEWFLIHILKVCNCLDSQGRIVRPLVDVLDRFGQLSLRQIEWEPEQVLVPLLPVDDVVLVVLDALRAIYAFLPALLVAVE